MKTILLTISILLLSILPTHAAKKIEANPINIAATLVEKTDSAKIASTLEYYGYNPQGTENNYCVMNHPNGTEIRFSFNENAIPSQYPTIIVKHNEPQKDLHSRLKELNFEKIGDQYERANNVYSRYFTKCISVSHNTLIFNRIHY